VVTSSAVVAAVRTVLLIDDEPDIRRIGELSLARVGGLTVHLASSGQEGVDAAARVQPDVILLDMMMPLMDGRATLAALKARADTAAIPVVFMTAKAQRQEVELFLALGAAGVITKPFDPMTLPAKVREIVAAGASR
jgi:CheY-like chemotaxis protein